MEEEKNGRKKCGNQIMRNNWGDQNSRDERETYLFLDRSILDGYRCGNAVLRLDKLQKENRILFREEYFADPPKPWEVRYDNSYPNVIYDKREGLFRCYYTLFTYDSDSMSTSRSQRRDRHYKPGPDRITSLCYAESKDGILWEKPALHLTEFNGSTENNILLRFAHGTGVFLDESDPDPGRRYKLITKIDYSATNQYMAAAFSEDGIHFGRLHPWPKHNPKADTHNFAFRDQKTGNYVLITRIFRNGVRIVAKCESRDFINWSEPEEIARGKGFGEQIYSMPVFQYRGLYLGLASIYHVGDYTAEDFDRVDCKLKFATCLDGWDDVCPEECLIERGSGNYPDGAFDCGCIYAAPPVEIDNRLWIYYMGGNGQHTDYRETSFARGYLEKDRFAHYEAKDPEEESVLFTRTFHIIGNGLELLADVEEGGYVIPEILAPRSREIYDGFGSCMLMEEEKGRYQVQYPGHSVYELLGKDAVMRIRFKKAKLYGLRGGFAFQQ